jgi:hypothetical protein
MILLSIFAIEELKLIMPNKNINTKRVAVITADVVNSTKINASKRSMVLSKMKQIFIEISKVYKLPKGSIEIFRGDSFQILIEDPSIALEVLLYVFFSLKIDDPIVVCRYSLGVGDMSFRAPKVIESDGTAFQVSGRMLDAISKSNALINISSDEVGFNTELEVHSLTLDFLLSNISSSQYNIFLWALCGYSQTEIANEIGVFQSSVTRTLKRSGWHVIEKIIKNYTVKTTIKQK